jgi:hypothetical protein
VLVQWLESYFPPGSRFEVFTGVTVEMRFSGLSRRVVRTRNSTSHLLGRRELTLGRFAVGK